MSSPGSSAPVVCAQGTCAPVVCAPLRVEAVALRGARTTVVRTGMGPRRSVRAAAGLPSRGRLVAGVAGGLHPAVRPGDVVVASLVRGPAGDEVACPSAPLLAAALRRLGLTVHVGPIESREAVLTGAARRALARDGALAVDTESVWLAAPGQPFAVVRSIVDTEAEPLVRAGTVARGVGALRALRRAVPAIDAWADRAVSAIDASAGRTVPAIDAWAENPRPRDVAPDLAGTREPAAGGQDLRFTLPEEVS